MARERLSNEERKNQIKKASMKVFLEKGFRNTVMNDIMEETGLSRGGLYHHYNCTGQILYDILEDGNHQREEVISSNIETSKKNPNEILVDSIVDKMLFKSDYVSIYAMFLQEIEHDKNLKALYEKLKESSTNGILKLFDEDDRKKLTLSIETITDVINTFILGCEILDARENFIKNKEAIKKMVLSILDKNQNI